MMEIAILSQRGGIFLNLGFQKPTSPRASFVTGQMAKACGLFRAWEDCPIST